MLHCWQDKWRVRSSVNVTMTSTFVSGPTAHRWHSLQLNQIVNNEAYLYRESLTAAFSQSLNSFVMLFRGTCYTRRDFGSMSEELVSIAFTGLTTLSFQVSLFEYFAICQFYPQWQNDERIVIPFSNLQSLLWWCQHLLTPTATQTACQKRHNFFPAAHHLTATSVQTATVRSVALNVLVSGHSSWIDVKATGISNFHSIDSCEVSGCFVSVREYSGIRGWKWLSGFLA